MSGVMRKDTQCFQAIDIAEWLQVAETGSNRIVDDHHLSGYSQQHKQADQTKHGHGIMSFHYDRSYTKTPLTSLVTCQVASTKTGFIPKSEIQAWLVALTTYRQDLWN